MRRRKSDCGGLIVGCTSLSLGNFGEGKSRVDELIASCWKNEFHKSMFATETMKSFCWEGRKDERGESWDGKEDVANDWEKWLEEYSGSNVFGWVKRNVSPLLRRSVMN